MYRLMRWRNWLAQRFRATDAPPLARKFDTYGNIRFNDEKARLDNFAIQLQNEPSAQGYIIGYGTCDAEGQNRANRARDYLVNTRGIDASRIVVVDGGCMPELRVDLWIVPSGATAPAADTTVKATGPTEPLATPISTGATLALEAQIAGLREVGELLLQVENFRIAVIKPAMSFL